MKSAQTGRNSRLNHVFQPNQLASIPCSHAVREHLPPRFAIAWMRA